MDLEASPNMKAVLLWRLNKEPCSKDISTVSWPTEYNITKLFFGSELIKSRLIKVLKNDFIEKSILAFIVCETELIVCHQA